MPDRRDAIALASPRPWRATLNGNHIVRGDEYADTIATVNDKADTELIVRAVNEYEELRAACRAALETITGLADQQAIPDDWYLATRARLIEALHG